jgi:hypothetical protein
MRSLRCALAALMAAACVLPATAQAPQSESAVAERLRRAGLPVNQRTLSGGDGKLSGDTADALARTYPLPPSVLNLRDQLPPDPEATMDALNLRRHPGVAPNQLPATAKSQEIRDALRP